MDKKLEEAIRKADRCNSLFSRAKGFMFSFSRKPKLLVFNKEKKVQIHTFFCFFSLRIIYLDKNFKIVKQKVVRPFRILPYCCAKYILEIPV